MNHKGLNGLCTFNVIFIRRKFYTKVQNRSFLTYTHTRTRRHMQTAWTSIARIKEYSQRCTELRSNGATQKGQHVQPKQQFKRSSTQSNILINLQRDKTCRRRVYTLRLRRTIQHASVLIFHHILAPTREHSSVFAGCGEKFGARAKLSPVWRIHHGHKIDVTPGKNRKASGFAPRPSSPSLLVGVGSRSPRVSRSTFLRSRKRIFASSSSQLESDYRSTLMARVICLASAILWLTEAKDAEFGRLENGLVIIRYMAQDVYVAHRRFMGRLYGPYFHLRCSAS